MQAPSLDLRAIQPTPADLAKYNNSGATPDADSKIDMPEHQTEMNAAFEEDFSLARGDGRVVELPRAQLMGRWRDLLRLAVQRQGVELGEVEAEFLHTLGYRGGDIHQFLSTLPEAAFPIGICRGLDKPFSLRFNAPNKYTKLHNSNNVFVLAYSESPPTLVVTPASYMTHQRLVRPPDYPLMFSSSRLPLDADMSIAVDQAASPAVRAAYQQAQANGGSVVLNMVFTRLPTGKVGMAIAGQAPIVQVKSGNQVMDATGTVAGGKFWTPKLTSEAVDLLHGRHPGTQRIRDLSLFTRVPTLAAQSTSPDRPPMSATLKATGATDSIRESVDALLDGDDGEEEGVPDFVAQLGRVSYRSDNTGM